MSFGDTYRGSRIRIGVSKKICGQFKCEEKCFCALLASVGKGVRIESEVEKNGSRRNSEEEKNRSRGGREELEGRVGDEYGVGVGISLYRAHVAVYPLTLL